MKFNIVKFNEAKFRDRTGSIPVPELAAFFEDEKDDLQTANKPPPVFIVRGLAGLELAECRDAMTKNRSFEALVDGLLSDKDEEKVQALKDALGIASETAPDDYVYRVACLRLGSVNPSLDETQSVRLALAYGTVFYKLTNKIIQLTGMGKQLGE